MRRQLLIEEAPDLAGMLRRMRSVLRFNGLWHARAEGSGEYAEAATPEEAIRLALELPMDDEPELPQPTRRRGLIE